jgi:hypothetical protein
MLLHARDATSAARGQHDGGKAARHEQVIATVEGFDRLGIALVMRRLTSASVDAEICLGRNPLVSWNR